MRLCAHRLTRAEPQDAVTKCADGTAPFYVVPSVRYEFEHPEDTGHATSPFFSFWFASGGPAMPRLCDAVAAERKRSAGGMFTTAAAKAAPRCELVPTAAELAARHFVPTVKRMNNKRRKALARKQAAGAAPPPQAKRGK
jgi:hypothetical protein